MATYKKVNHQAMASSSIAGSMLAIAATLSLLAGPAFAEPAQHCESNIGSPDNLKELNHGLVEGYLPRAHSRIHLNCFPPHQKQALLLMRST